MNWQLSKTKPGTWESLGGSHTIERDGNGFVLIANPDEYRTLGGKTWTKKFRSLEAAQTFSMTYESPAEEFAHQVRRAFEMASKTRQQRLRREFPTELELVGLIVKQHLLSVDDDCLSGRGCRKLNELAKQLAVAERL